MLNNYCLSPFVSLDCFVELDFELDFLPQNERHAVSDSSQNLKLVLPIIGNEDGGRPVPASYLMQYATSA